MTDTPKWYQIMSQDSRWPQRDDQVWIEDVENIYITKHGIDLDQGRVLLAEAALCAFEWLQTEKGQIKKPRGMRTFFLNWLKREGDGRREARTGNGPPGGIMYPNTPGNPGEKNSERRKRDIDDLQRRIALHAKRTKAEKESDPGAKG